MPGFIGIPELLLLGLVVLVLFGPKRLPEMGRSLGHGLREFKDSVTGSDDAKEEPARRSVLTAPDAPATEPRIDSDPARTPSETSTTAP